MENTPLTHKEKRTLPPVDDHLIDFRFPGVKERRLPNGLTVLIIERHEIPKVWVRVGFDFGTRDDPEEKTGLTRFLEATLKKGTTSRDYDAIVDTVERSGGELDALVSDDYFFVYGKFLRDSIDSGMEVAADILRHPLFPEEEVEKERAKLISDLENEKSSPNFLANRRVKKLLYSPHPYSRQKTRRTLLNISRQDLLDFHRRYFSPASAYLVLAGDITEQAAMALAESHLGDWPPAEFPRPAYPLPHPLRKSLLHIVNRPDSEQVTILLGNQLFPRNHPDYEKMMVMNKILGGGGSGRLFLYLREEKGFTYGAYSMVQTYREAGGWLAQAEVRPEVTAEALQGFWDQFEKIRSEPVPEEELRNARRYLVGSFPLQNETPASVAALALQQKLYGLPADYWDHYLEKIGSVTAVDVRDMARKYIRPDRMATVLVGDADQLLKQLPPTAHPAIFDADDHPITEER